MATRRNLEFERLNHTVPQLWLCTTDTPGIRVCQGLRCSAALSVISSNVSANASQIIVGCVGGEDTTLTCRIPLAAWVHERYTCCQPRRLGGDLQPRNNSLCHALDMGLKLSLCCRLVGGGDLHRDAKSSGRRGAHWPACTASACRQGGQPQAGHPLPGRLQLLERRPALWRGWQGAGACL